jgi:hypothetical protein
VVLHPDRMELTVTVAQSTALRLADPKSRIRGTSKATFAQRRELFEREAAALHVITSGRATKLVARKTEVELTDENDVVFKATYPRPEAGRLHFHAAFLKKLGESYGGMIEINLPGGENLGWEQLSFDNPNFEITVPPQKKVGRVIPNAPLRTFARPENGGLRISRPTLANCYSPLS